MPEPREVFEMVRQRTEPLIGAWVEQEARQHRVTRNRKIGAIALSIALLAVGAWFAVTHTYVSDRSNRPANQPVNGPTNDPFGPHPPGSVYLFDLDTGGATRVPGIVAPAPLTPGFAVSPDRSLVTFADGGVIQVANIDGTGRRALEGTDATGCIMDGPEFSPAGSSIVYQAKDCRNGMGDLYLVDVLTGGTTRLTHLEHQTSEIWDMGPTFSPDGQTVYFTRPAGVKSWDLWSVPTSGGEPTPVLRGAIGGRVSPDGQTILYFKPRVTPEDPLLGQLWVANLDGTDPRRLAVGDVISARWSPDGRKISYSTDQGRQAHVVDVATGETSRVLGNTHEFPAWVDDHTWIIGLG